MMKRTGRLVTLFFALLIAAGMVTSLSACGKKGALEPPPKKEETEKRR
jgi:predicted small lipoprotein YifL